jgi:P4 family phage/plasmid primase-like protien
MHPKDLMDLGVLCFPATAPTYSEELKKWVKNNMMAGVPWGKARDEKWPYDHPHYAGRWESGVWAFTPPPGVVVLDIDYRKGVTLDAIDAALGCKLNWSGSLIQRTVSGGTHHAFRCSAGVKTGSNTGGVVGMDTRAHGTGLVFSGNWRQGGELKGYHDAGLAGPRAVAYPEALPEIPEAALRVLAPARSTTVATARPMVTSNLPLIVEMLKCISPDCERDVWLRVCFALNYEFAEDPETGLNLCHDWATGRLLGHPEPLPEYRYEEDTINRNWERSNPNKEGGSTGGTLYNFAVAGGYKPSPRDRDWIAAAFGKDGGAIPETWERLVDAVRTSGGDAKEVPTIILDILGAGCSSLQKHMLAAELTVELKASGSWTKTLGKEIEKQLFPNAGKKVPQIGQYDKFDAVNVATFMAAKYPEGGLVYANGLFYKWVGTHYKAFAEEAIEAELDGDMTQPPMPCNKSTVREAFKMLKSSCRRAYDRLTQPNNEAAANYIRYANGVLDLRTMQLHSHDSSQFVTNVLPYSYDPLAGCPEWMDFLRVCFSHDQQRIDLLQEWIGYQLTRSYKYQKFMFFRGGPRSGKGTVGRVLKELVGRENYSGGGLEDLARDSAMDGLSNKQCFFIGDAQAQISKAKVNVVIEKLKGITGNDDQSWGRKYARDESGTLPCRITITSNSLPRMFDDSGALGGRMLYLPFDVSHEGREDHGLEDRLKSELPGIANWALLGMLRLNASGRWTSPDSTREELQDIRDTYSPVGAFLREYVEITGSTTDTATREAVHKQYNEWERGQGQVYVTPFKQFCTAFGDALRGKPARYTGKWVPEKKTSERMYVGLRLKWPDAPPATATAKVIPMTKP